MRARAPGKIVLSGAYAVLEGAPAIVVAVDRYAFADSSRAAEFATPEVAAALGARPAPWFDASALRAGDRKLGLGSSAAILVASLGALALEANPELGDAELALEVYAPALAAHALAQGGGSGVDVAASVHGGVLVARREPGGLALERATLPAGLSVHVLAAGRSASTPELIGRVRALALHDPSSYARLLGKQAEASERAARALLRSDAPGLVGALAEQAEALRELGRAARAPIVTDELVELSREAMNGEAAVLPAGAGGGDIALWVSATGSEPPRGHGHVVMDLELGATGLCRSA